MQQDTWIVLSMCYLGVLGTFSYSCNDWRQQLTHTCQTHSNLALNILSFQINPGFHLFWPENKKNQCMESGSHLLGPGSSVQESYTHVWPHKILVLRNRKRQPLPQWNSLQGRNCTKPFLCKQEEKSHSPNCWKLIGSTVIRDHGDIFSNVQSLCFRQQTRICNLRVYCRHWPLWQCSLSHCISISTFTGTMRKAKISTAF